MIGVLHLARISRGLPGVQRGELSQVVYSYIRERVAHGEYGPATVLTESDLTHKTGVSRTPVRAALHRLISEGVVEHTPSRRVRVATTAAEEVAHLYALRIFMETIAVRITVPQLTMSDHETLQACVETMTQSAISHDYSQWQPCHELFHQIVVSKAPTLWVHSMAELRARAEPYRKIYTREVAGGWQTKLDDHKDILAAVLQYDARAAAEATLRHYGKVGQLTLAVLDPFDGSDPGIVLRETLSLLGGMQMNAREGGRP